MIEVLFNTQIREVSGYIGNFKTVIRAADDQERELTFGNIIAAVGLKPPPPRSTRQ